jgi:cation diffusion facilitator CzcD-associated flavoprotein CzcO
VIQAAWDDETLRWTVRARDATGAESHYEAHAVISVVGQLNRPQISAIEGAERFAGTAFQSARWPADLDLAGQRVGIIEAGASTVQFAPFVAVEAASTCVFQRSPAWLMRTPELHEPTPDRQRWLFEHITGYRRWFRFGQFMSLAEGLLPCEDRPRMAGRGRIGERRQRRVPAAPRRLHAPVAGRPARPDRRVQPRTTRLPPNAWLGTTARLAGDLTSAECVAELLSVIAAPAISSSCAGHMIVGDDNSIFTASLAEFLATLPGRPA